VFCYCVIVLLFCVIVLLCNLKTFFGGGFRVFGVLGGCGIYWGILGYIGIYWDILGFEKMGFDINYIKQTIQVLTRSELVIL